MKILSKSIFGLFAALILLLSLTNTQSARAFVPRGENLAASTPPLLLNIKAIDLGDHHTCALTNGGAVKCWGNNGAGQLGDGTTSHRFIPVNVVGLSNGISAISAGAGHTCALTSSGGVKCWGANSDGELGDGTTTGRTTPTAVFGLSSGVIAISANGYHTCALTSAGGVKCWGDNEFGQLGDGTITDRLTPVDVSGLTSGVSAISSGFGHTCALTSAGGVKCWGYNYHGQLGDETTTNRRTPTDVFGLSNGVIAIAAGGNHTCALTSAGGAMCWGYNRKGQLGNGQNTNSPRPINVSGLASGTAAISGGSFHTCALTSEGGMKCWGLNHWGELGDGTKTDRNTPVDVTGLISGISAVSLGSYHTCALTTEGGVKCSGWNQYGQLGDGSGTTRLTPVDVLMLDQLVFRSIGAQDGYIWESIENSGVGFKANSTNTTFRVGDDNSNRQYRGFLSFNTSPLPDTAVIISAEIELRTAGGQGDPFWLGPLILDIRRPFWGESISLLPNDFQSAPSMNTANIINWAGSVEEWLKNAAFPYINLTGFTQFRIRFQKDDDDDMSADYYEPYSGDAAFGNRPILVIRYYVP
jgi:alpha-tubulin suppressor-like RCC1 family protein